MTAITWPGGGPVLVDCGSGVSAITRRQWSDFARMDKVFINHLHGDHMNDLTHIYTLAAAADRNLPLRLGFGPLRRRKPARHEHHLQRRRQ